MAKYLILWEMANDRLPAEQKEAMALVMKQIEMTKQGLATGQLTDWGIFPGANGGFALSEGDAAAVMIGCQLAAHRSGSSRIITKNRVGLIISRPLTDFK